MNNKKKETKILCPRCGTEFAIAEKEYTTVATVVGKDSGLGVVYPTTVERQTPARLPKTAQDRIEALRNAGVDVSCLFAMRGSNGGECIASNKDGKLVMLDDNDPLFDHIIAQGTVPNRRLFRRWVVAQMFYMLSYIPCASNEPAGITYMIHRLGYAYQWKMLMNELNAQMKMESRDLENFTDRNRWFNADVVTAMAQDYMVRLKERIDALKERKCKGIPYKRINNHNIFVADLYNKLYHPLNMAMAHIQQAKNAAQLYNAARKFNDIRIRMPWNTPQSKAWVDAYKGSGAFFTMQNLIRFHNCFIIDDAGNRLDKYQSLAFISAKAEMYKDGEGWRLLAVLKKMLSDNNIDIREKMAAWRKKE